MAAHSTPPEDRQTPTPPETPTGNGAVGGLTDRQLAVLDVLERSGRPLDAIEVASLARLSLADALATLQELAERGYAERLDPQPLHQRYALDVQELQKTLV